MLYTVLKYIKIQFNGEWTRSMGTVASIYTPIGNKNELLVVTQSPTGAEITYSFNVTSKEGEVWVNANENIVQIPGTCHTQTPGDSTNCGR